MSFFNEKLSFGLRTGIYICPDCGSELEFEDEEEYDTLVCLNCGYEVSLEDYGATDDEIEERYLTKDEFDARYN